MPTLRPATLRHQPGRYAEPEFHAVDTGIRPMAVAPFIRELSWTCAFPTRELSDPRRHPNEALADFHRAARGVLHHTLADRISSCESDSDPREPPRGPTDQDKEDFLTEFIDGAKRRLDREFSKWLRRCSEPRQTDTKDSTAPREKRKRETPAAVQQPAPDQDAEASSPKKKRKRGRPKRELPLETAVAAVPQHCMLDTARANHA